MLVKQSIRDTLMGKIVWISIWRNAVGYEQNIRYVKYFLLSQGPMNLAKQVSYAAVSNHDPQTQIQPYNDDKSGYNP